MSYIADDRVQQVCTVGFSMSRVVGSVVRVRLDINRCAADGRPSFGTFLACNMAR